MKKIDAIAREIETYTQSVNGLDQLGRTLVAKHREYAVHLRNGLSYEEIAQSHIEEQTRLYFVYTLDRPTWQQLVARAERFASEDPNAMAPMFSKWAYLHEDLVENIGGGLGWRFGGPARDLHSVPFEERLGMIVSAFEGLTSSQIRQLEVGLGQEDSASPARSGACYIATAVYGGYESPEVRVLRRWRDRFLSSSTFGRGLIRLYYKVSPHLVGTLGHNAWFIDHTRRALNLLVRHLGEAGYSDEPYLDELERLA